MFHTQDASFYPKSALFRQGRSLYNWRHLGVSESFWNKTLDKCKNDVRIQINIYIDDINRDWFLSILKFSFANGLEGRFYLGPRFNVVFPMFFIWKIQRAMRRFLRKRFEERAVAVMMCLHSRLGQVSELACLHEDTLQSVVGLLKKE